MHIQNPSATRIPVDGKSAGNKPVSVKLEAQKLYAFCSCGHSEKQVCLLSYIRCACSIESCLQPFCDGSHKGAGKTLLRPIRFTVDKTDNYWLCMCKHTKKTPLCDGTHKTVCRLSKTFLIVVLQVNDHRDKPSTAIAFGNSPVYDGVARQLGYKYKNGGFQ